MTGWQVVLATCFLASGSAIADDSRSLAAQAEDAWVAKGADVLSAEQLCDSYGQYASRAARRELDRRHTFTPAEWALIDSQQIQVGESELALHCTWGKAPVNRTVTVAGPLKQYVYSRTYVYVANGRIVSFQDHSP